MYNVLAIHGVIATGVRESVMEIPSFFGVVAYRVGNFVLTLDEIENGILRRNAPHPATGSRLFDDDDPRLALCPSRVDPRIHTVAGVTLMMKKHDVKNNNNKGSL